MPSHICVDVSVVPTVQQACAQVPVLTTAHPRLAGRRTSFNAVLTVTVIPRRYTRRAIRARSGTLPRSPTGGRDATCAQTSSARKASSGAPPQQEPAKVLTGKRMQPDCEARPRSRKVADIGDMPTAADGTPARDDSLPEPARCRRCRHGMRRLYAALFHGPCVQRRGLSECPADHDRGLLRPGEVPRETRNAPRAVCQPRIRPDRYGVPLADVYDTLGTPEGMSRAFANLDTIKEHIVWWEAGAQPPQLLADREVAMSTACDGRIFDAQALEHQPSSWSGMARRWTAAASASWREPAASRRRAACSRSRPDPRSWQASASTSPTGRSCSPAPRSGTSLVTTHLETGVDMAPHMPTTPANLANRARALQNDWRWWPTMRTRSTSDSGHGSRVAGDTVQGALRR